MLSEETIQSENKILQDLVVIAIMEYDDKLKRIQDNIKTNNAVEKQNSKGEGRGWWGPPKGTHTGGKGKVSDNNKIDDNTRRSKIIEASYASGYLEDQILNYPNEIIKDLYEHRKSLAKLSDERLEEVYLMREKLYNSEDEFHLANQWLGSIVGNGADIRKKARDMEFNPSKEIELSKQIMKKRGKLTGFRNQPESQFRSEGSSRWGDMPYTHSNSGVLLKTTLSEKNVLIHPEVLYSWDFSNGGIHYRNEREYVLENSEVKILRT